MSALNVQIGADVADLQTKLAIAQAEVKATSKEVRDFADQMVEASDAAKAELLPQLQAAATASASAKAEVASLKAELTELTPAAHEAGGAFVALRETTEGLNVRISETKGLFTGLGELFLVGLGAEKFAELGEAAGEFGESMEKASLETGLTSDALQGLSYAADRNGVAFDTLQRGIAKMGQNSEQAVAGSKKQEAAFQALGISTAELREHGDDAQYMLERVARALDQYGDGLNKETLVTDIFGAKLRDMNPVLHEIAEDGITGLIAKNDELGDQFSGKFVDSAAAGEKQLKDFHREVQAVELELGGPLIKAIVAAGDALNQLFHPNSDATALTDLRAYAANIQGQIDKIKANGDDPSFWQRFVSGGKTELTELEAELDQTKQKMAELQDPGVIVTHHNLGEYKPEAPDVGELQAGLAKEKSLKQEAYQEAIAEDQAEAAQYSNYSDERIAILGKELATAKEYWGEGSKQYAEIQRQMTTAEREQLGQRIKQGQQTMQEDTQSFISTREAELSADIAHENALVTQKKVTVEAAAAEEVKLTDAVYAQLVKRMDLEITMVGDDLALYTKLSNEKIALVQKEQDQIQKINDKAADEEMRKALQTDQTIAKSGAQTGAQLIFGKETVAQAAEEYAELAVEKALEWGLKEVLAHVGFEAQKVTATAVGEQAQVAAKIAGTAEGKAVEAAAGSASVMGDAAKAYAGAYSAVVGIPYIGPILAPIAGGVAYAAVAAYDVFSAEGGIDRVPYDDAPFLLHENETVLSSGPADMLRELVSRGPGSAGGDTHNHYSVDMSGSTFGGGTNPSQIEGMVVSALQKAHRKLAFT